jgi:hypothetical protein
MSSGSPRTGPNPRLKYGLKKRLSIGQQSWTKGRRKASRLNKNCRARGGTDDSSQTPPSTTTSLLTKPGADVSPHPFPSTFMARCPQHIHRADSRDARAATRACCATVHRRKKPVGANRRPLPSLQLEIFRRFLALVWHDVIGDFGTLVQVAQTRPLDG